MFLYLFKRFITICLLFFLFCGTGKSQTQISGIINTYTNVVSIDAIDLITVGNTTGFHVGDTVMVIQMKGATYDTNNSALLGMNGTGRYEFIIINQVFSGTNQFQFRSNLLNFVDYIATESIQVIRVPSFNKVKVTAPLTCAPWDGSKGGVIALIANDTLILNDSIYASSKGYNGALYTQNNGFCPSTKGLLHYTVDKLDSAGFKGEGIVSNSFIYKRGRGSVVNAGGGGYGKFAGGGGGGNFGSGGRGGIMKETLPTCNDPNILFGGSGGQSDKILPYYFGALSSEYQYRVFMGGGGGAGTGNVAGAGTRGGNGGGIVFIIARNVVTNSKYISSNGEDVTAIASNEAGAGGGGAGGAILLSVDEFSGPINVSVKGGKGGSTSYCWGQGGGGGGGIVWFSLPSLSFTNLKWSGGTAGGPSGACSNYAFNGENGDTSNNFNAVLNGFLFNLISKEHTICYGDIPQLLKGSYPRGGDGKYKYQWQKRLKSTSWGNISGANSKDYQSTELFDTTFFRRIVKVYQPQWNDTVVDTSKFILVNVIPEIQFNQIDADTAICYGLPQVKLRGKTPTGGIGIFSYLWESKSNSSDWVSADGINNQIDYANTSNTQTLYYRRKVFSSICSTISDIDTIIIYPKITGNTISSNQIICYNYNPSRLNGSIPSDGSGTYVYKWEQSINDSSTWSNLGISTQNYSPPKLIQKTYFHRIVYSGLNNTCIDTSNWVRINITSPVVNNTIQSEQTICEGIIPSLFTGSNPTGGNSMYSFQWEKSTNDLSWDSITTSTSLKDYQHQALFDTTYFRRIVRSGFLDCCKDTSISVKITVQPKIYNNTISSNQEICSGQTPSVLNQSSGSVTGGDKVSYGYSWEQKIIPNGNWNLITGANSLSYQPPSLTQTTFYRRKVVSGECFSFSDSLKMNVLPSISGNLLTGNNEVCRNIQPGMISGGSVTGGEIGVYRYQWQDSTTVTWNTISGATDANYTPPVIPVKTYYRRIVKSGLNDCCISNSAPFELRINELPVGNIQSLDTSICIGGNIKVNISLSGNSPFSLQLTDQTNTYDSNGLNSGVNPVEIVPLNSGGIQINTITDSKGCLAINKTGNVNVRLVQVPVANAGSDDQVCGLSYSLNASLTIGTGEWILPVEANYSPSKFEPDAIITVSNYGTYEIKWKESNEFCSDTSKISISFFEQPQKPVLQNDTTIYYQTFYNLIAPEPLAGNGKWISSVEGVTIQYPNNPNTIAEQLKFGKYEFIWEVTNGNCISVKDTLMVDVEDVLRYTGFSPNNDDINDFFVIQGLENAQKRKLVIMNRWGGVVYSNDNYQNDWNGTNSDGQALPDDTYFYVLTLDDSRNYKGFIVLKR